MTIISTSDNTFQVDSSKTGPILLDFWAPWCGPCKAIEPQLVRLADRLEGRLDVLKINIDENPALRERFGVRGIPTLVFLAKGEERGRLAGTSATRLAVTVEQWMADVGEDNVNLLDAGEAGTDDARPQNLLSFNADDAVKQACIDRLLSAAQERSFWPSRAINAGSGSLEAELGLPADYGGILNLVWGQAAVRHNERTIDPLLDFLRITPVGKDLRKIVGRIRYEVLYASPWPVMQYVHGTAAESYLGQVKALQTREYNGQVVSPSEWASVQRAVILNEDKEVQRLEGVAVSLWDEGWGASYGFLTNVSVFAASKGVWSRSDHAEIDGITMEFKKIAQEKAGPMPKDDQQAIGRWVDAVTEGMEVLKEESKKSRAEFWERFDIWVGHHQDITTGIRAFVLARTIKDLTDLAQ
ncbi:MULTISPECIES: thioredoxin family protein [Paraburkholderia]|uniref:thioredoxin family protein n=1 Tax=Paraburkholderia TaxID=1822464 RepID=UPI002AB1B7E3|nr:MULTISPECIES: thioredoxin family protein [Paraburkholderia]